MKLYCFKTLFFEDASFAYLIAVIKYFNQLDIDDSQKKTREKGIWLSDTR